MTKTVTGLVLAGIIYALLLGIGGYGFDVYAAVIFVLLAGVGVLSVAVVRRSTQRIIQPAECKECGGLVSPNAPYCKHCGANLEPKAG